jgi:hypothetical protein
MLVQRNKDSAIGYGALNNLKIVGTILAYLCSSHHVIPLAPKCQSHFYP